MLELQADLDLWIREYNEQRTHQDSKPNRSTRHRLSDRVSANNNTH